MIIKKHDQRKDELALEGPSNFGVQEDKSSTSSSHDEEENFTPTRVKAPTLEGIPINRYHIVCFKCKE